MRNPAWRPARLQAKRLSGIQHHFIDECQSSRTTGHPGIIRTLPVFMAVTPGHPATALQPRTLVNTLTCELNKQISADLQHWEWRLQAIPPESGATHAARGFILVFATANLEGVRLAYTLIKKLSASSTLHCGVLFSGAADPEDAQSCQERLASGAWRFLGIRLHDLGHLAGPGPDFSIALAHLAETVHLLWEAQ